MSKKLQIFTDASISKNKCDFVGTIGGHILDQDGKNLFVFFDQYKNISKKGLKTSQIFVAETMAIFRGIEHAIDIARDLKIKEIVINSDNRMCIEYMQFYQMNTEKDCLDFKSIYAYNSVSPTVLELSENILYESVSLLKDKFDYFEIKHIPRDKNQFADYMAEYAKSLFFNKKDMHRQYVKNLSKNLINDIIYDLTEEQSQHRKTNKHQP